LTFVEIGIIFEIELSSSNFNQQKFSKSQNMIKRLNIQNHILVKRKQKMKWWLLIV